MEPNKLAVITAATKAKIEYVNGFKSKAEAEKWRETTECQNWRARRGYL